MKFLCDQCKAKYQIADEKAAGKTVRMKCRKCGHFIEVRAGVMESSIVSMPPDAGPSPSSAPDRAGPPRPQPARAAPLATSLASAKPTSRDKSGVLAGAFKSTVQREEEISVAAADLSELSPSDEWYVAINGVPVGPIRIAEVRRKAALGGVTEESLAWQEGLDEWRPVRSFPELAAIVREAAAAGRPSLTPPPPPGRASSIPPPPRATSARPLNTTGPSRALPPPRTAFAPPPQSAAAARSNVVAITSRLATAEKLEEVPDEAIHGSAVRDPFANPAVGSAPPASGDRAPMLLAAPVSLAPSAPRSRRQPPWIAIAMVAAAVAFGSIAGIATFFRPAPPPPAPVIVQVPAQATATTTGATAAAQVPVSADSPDPVPTAVAIKKTGAGSATAKESPSTAPPTRGPLDLHSLAQNQTNIGPADDSSGDSTKAPGQCFSGAQVQQVIGLHKTAIQRACWERNPSTKIAVNVTVSFTIQSDGSAQSVSASAEDPTVAKCVENDVRGWRFPALGCTQATQFSYKFVRQ